MPSLIMTPPSAAMELTDWMQDPDPYTTEASNTTLAADSDKTRNMMKLVSTIQIWSLWVLFALGVVGNTMVMIWMHLNRRRKSRVNTIVLGIASADMSVCFFSMLPTAIILMSSTWEAGNFMCKLVMYFQGASLISSANMLALMAIDRHQAVLQPLKEFFVAWKLVVISWAIAGTLALPQLYVWGQRIRSDKPRCGSVFRNQPAWHRVTYITYIAVITFLIPFLVVTFAYLRISKKIWDKAQETSGKRSKRASKKNKIELNRNAPGNTLTKAKTKTLKMSVVIIFFFVLCGTPYFIVELLGTFRGPSNPFVEAFFGIFAVANSATNPYIFLYFNTSQRCWKEFRLSLNRFLCCCARGDSEGGYYNRYSVRFSSSNSRTEFTKIPADSSVITRITEAPNSRAVPPAKDHECRGRLGRTE
ncbi:cardioacceleratory peptide receptor-like [Diadema setosum]|uniref:cardioacceleratory peptide receptor-like n=1 Tax=Diadema setosum TaxID=31175 RepID=UPI003B3A79F6